MPKDKKSTIEVQGTAITIISHKEDDLISFTDLGGFPSRNLKYMRKYAQTWSDREIVQRTVAQFPWCSNLTLLKKMGVH